MGFIAKYNRFIQASIHIIIWAVLFILPLMFTHHDRKPNYPWLIVNAWVPLVEYMIVFYANYFSLVRKLLFKRKYVAFALANAAIVLVFLWVNGKCHGYLMEMDMKKGVFPHHKPPHFGPPVFTFIFADLISFFIPIAFAVATRSTQHWLKTESEKKEIENKNLQSELLHLRYQLQPHFFFNALNNIYSLVEQAPEKAQEAIHNLSKLMRYLLYDTGRDKIELSKEIDFLKKFIQLMELRHTNRTVAHFTFPDTEKNKYYIAPLLFISMIENAYKHGISATQQSDISFEMKIEENELFFTSKNSNFPKSGSDKSGSGIGLNNLRKRLELIYPKKYELKSGVMDNVYFIELKINLN